MPQDKSRKPRRKKRNRQRNEQEHSLPWMEFRDHDKYQEAGSGFGVVAILSGIAAVIGAIGILVGWFIDKRLYWPEGITVIALAVFVRSFFVDES